MLLKAFCIAVVGYSYFCILAPPRIGKEVNKTGDKVGRDSSFVKAHKFYTLNIAPPTTILFTTLYIYLLWQGKISPELKLWQVSIIAVHLYVYNLRMRAYQELGRMFTYTIMIRSQHKLITTGPYKHLRHPSYSGVAIGAICFKLLLFNEGIWDVIIYPLVGLRFLGIITLGIFIMFHGLFLMRRIHYEEAMMADHFGKEWTEFAEKRWRIIRFIY